MQGAAILFTSSPLVTEFGRQSKQFITIIRNGDGVELRVTDRKVQSLGEVIDLINYFEKSEEVKKFLPALNDKVYRVHTRDILPVRFWKHLTCQMPGTVKNVEGSNKWGRVLKYEKSYFPAVASNIDRCNYRCVYFKHSYFDLFHRSAVFVAGIITLIAIIPIFFLHINTLYVSVEQFNWKNRVIKWIDLVISAITPPFIMVIVTIKMFASAVIHPIITTSSAERILEKSKQIE